MSSTAAAPAKSNPAIVRGPMDRSEARAGESAAGATSPPALRPRTSGYGLPCSKCRTYYPADLKVCPVCQGTERVAPTKFQPPAAVIPTEPTPDPAVLEEERERFLRDFKAQLFTSQMQMSSTAAARCVREGQHQGGSEPATICQNCYDHVQERVDVLEAAMHMDLKEAAQIVYDAVWADSSDPGKTYENAANALLTELRRRSGTTPTFGLMKPLTD